MKIAVILRGRIGGEPKANLYQQTQHHQQQNHMVEMLSNPFLVCFALPV